MHGFLTAGVSSAGLRVSGRPICMSIPLLQKNLSLIARAGSRIRQFGWGLALAFSLASSVHGWTKFDLPPLVSSAPHYGAVAMGHFADGRFIYGNNNQLYVQNSFGAAGLTALAAPPDTGVDPSFIAVLNGQLAVAGAGGGFGNTSLYKFDPTDTTSPDYLSFDSLQNYSGVMRNATSLYITGDNGTGGKDAVSVVKLDGSMQIVIDQISLYSGDIARDAAGNLFVGDDANFGVYKFTPAQLNHALATNTTLAIDDGVLIHKFPTDVVGSLAVDGRGRVWAAGFGSTGVFWWDPVHKLGGSLAPQGNSGAYKLTAFSTDGKDYVGFVWQAGFITGDRVIYAYALADQVLAPIITTQPTPVTTTRGKKVQFTAVASGTGKLQYRWQKNGVDVVAGPRVSGVKTTTLKISLATAADAGRYRIIVSSPEGETASKAALLTIQ
jgi:hypothetical protein